MELQVNYSDNSHIFGRPMKVWEEMHCELEATREEAKVLIPGLLKLGVEAHIVFKD